MFTIDSEVKPLYSHHKPYIQVIQGVYREYRKRDCEQIVTKKEPKATINLIFQRRASRYFFSAEKGIRIIFEQGVKKQHEFQEIKFTDHGIVKKTMQNQAALCVYMVQNNYLYGFLGMK